jgi:hypothetical protein
MKSVFGTARILLGRRHGLTAPRGQNSARNQSAAGDLLRAHRLGQEDEREDGGNERLQIGNERRP